MDRPCRVTTPEGQYLGQHSNKHPTHPRTGPRQRCLCALRPKGWASISQAMDPEEEATCWEGVELES